MKHTDTELSAMYGNQPPSGGCVLKLYRPKHDIETAAQPPSGGCVLKLENLLNRRVALASRLRAAVC